MVYNIVKESQVLITSTKKYKHFNMVSYKAIALVLCISGVLATDPYLAEVKEECRKSRDFTACGKHEVLSVIANAASAANETQTIKEGLGIVTMKKPVEEPEGVFSGARQMPGDSEFKKFFKFILRQADTFVGSRSISVPLPEGVKIVDAEQPDNEIGIC